MQERINELKRNLRRISWLPVLAYIVLACVFAWPFHYLFVTKQNIFRGFPPIFGLQVVSIMWGPGLAALVCLALFPRARQRSISIFGSSRIRSILFFCLPFSALAVAQKDLFAKDNIPIYVMPLLYCFFMLRSALGEELGWRGYLQDRLKPLGHYRFVVIGVIWEFWHIIMRTASGWNAASALRIGVMLLCCIGLSFIIGFAVERSKSVLVATALHAWIDILFEMPRRETYLIFAASLVLWMVLLATWEKSGHPAPFALKVSDPTV